MEVVISALSFSTYIVMAPKKNSEGDGILAKVIRMFNAGELDISVDSLILRWKKFLCVRNIKSLEGAICVARRYM